MVLSSLKIRLISALVIGPLSLFIFYLGGWPLMALMAVTFGISVHEWLSLSRKTSRFWLYAPIGLLYFILCFYSFLSIRLHFDQGFFLIISLAMVVWAGDVGAYFSGKVIGGPKMARAISPNKTWAGLGGGMIFSGLYMLSLYYIGAFVGSALPFAAAYVAFLIGACLTIVGQLGDLLMSAAKRRAGIKDTGHLIPGHGGLLDRIDSLLLASLFFYIALKVFGL